MPNTIVIPEGAPPPVGPFAPARIASGSKVLTISGQIADGPDGGVVGGDGAEEQARQCLRNIDALLRSAGATRDDVVKVGIFLTDIADRALSPGLESSTSATTSRRARCSRSRASSRRS